MSWLREQIAVRITSYNVCYTKLLRKEALDTANLAAKDLELCIFTGMARDAIEPATAHILSAKLGSYNFV